LVLDAKLAKKGKEHTRGNSTGVDPLMDETGEGWRKERDESKEEGGKSV